jgi:hypothetical protein
VTPTATQGRGKVRSQLVKTSLTARFGFRALWRSQGRGKVRSQLVKTSLTARFGFRALWRSAFAMLV